MEFLRVAEAMSKSIVTVGEGASVAEASLSMYDKREGCAIVLRQGKPFGIVTDRDVTWKVAGKGLDPKNVKVAEIMSTPLITIDANADLSEAAKTMKKHNIWRLAVIKGDTLQGVLTAADIASSLEKYVDREMRDILGYLVSPRYLPEEG
ncbi:MAG TPA: CBS domain-containing protein [Candidatus Eisenbacteria bacterium]|nr:CBS domain-containing protein [Candidatus Eisenbacteria bacterium]